MMLLNPNEAKSKAAEQDGDVAARASKVRERLSLAERSLSSVEATLAERRRQATADFDEFFGSTQSRRERLLEEVRDLEARKAAALIPVEEEYRERLESLEEREAANAAVAERNAEVSASIDLRASNVSERERALAEAGRNMDSLEAELDARAASLSAGEATLAANVSSEALRASQRAGSLSEREMSVLERELSADARWEACDEREQRLRDGERKLADGYAALSEAKRHLRIA